MKRYSLSENPDIWEVGINRYAFRKKINKAKTASNKIKSINMENILDVV